MSLLRPVAGILLVAAAALPQSDDRVLKSGIPSELRLLSEERGDLLYRRSCLPCHGPEGTGSETYSSTLASPSPLKGIARTEREWIKRIADGSQNNLCPPWKWTYSSDDLQRLARHILHLTR